MNPLGPPNPSDRSDFAEMTPGERVAYAIKLSEEELKRRIDAVRRQYPELDQRWLVWEHLRRTFPANEVPSEAEWKAHLMKTGSSED